MNIDNALILRLETLARLELSETERVKLLKDLANILTMVDKLNELDVDGVEPLIYIGDEVNVFREDEVRHQVSKAEALKNAPDHNADYFRVPKVVEL